MYVNKSRWQWNGVDPGIPVSKWNARVLSLDLKTVRGLGCAGTSTAPLAVQVTHGKQGASMCLLSQIQLNVKDVRGRSQELGRMGQ